LRTRALKESYAGSGNFLIYLSADKSDLDKFACTSIART